MLDVRRWLTPPVIAEQLGVKPSKVVGWIERGELKGVNVADRQGRGRRPRWRVSAEAFEAFLRAREAVPRSAPNRGDRSYKSPHVIEFFK